MRRTITLGMALWMGLGTQAWAHVVDHAFKDVPPAHWAADSVGEMAVKRSLMRSFADDTFRGEQPFTRAQFAESLMVLVDELETLSKTSWRDGAAAGYGLADVPEASAERRQIVTVVNDYRLWEGVPTISRDHFYPGQTVTRSEVASVIRNLLAAGEAKGAVLARDPRDPQNRFKDLKPSEWAYQAILGVDQRYRVMIGFPDVTFRPEDELSRFQYAAVGRATFEIIRDLVRKTIEEKEALAEKLRRDRFQEQRPWAFALSPGYSLKADSSSAPGSDGLNLALGARYVAYPANVLGLENWFGLAEARVGVGPGAAASLTLGAFPQGPVLALGAIGDLQLQPYLGVRGMVDAMGKAPEPGLAPLVFGGVAYWRKGVWGAYALADGSPFAVVPTGLGGFTGNLSVGAEYLLSSKLSVGGGVGLTKLPSNLLPAPTLGVNLAF